MRRGGRGQPNLPGWLPGAAIHRRRRAQPRHPPQHRRLGHRSSRARCRRDRAQLHVERRRAPRLRHRAAARGPRGVPRPPGRLGRRRRGWTLRRSISIGARGRGARRERVSFGRNRHSRLKAPAARRRHRGATVKDLDWDKGGGLLPAVVQDAGSGAVLMLGYMNREALAATQATGRVTFWSRSKGRTWIKGETSGHFLKVRQIAVDCDADTLLILAEPAGPACHLGTATCWGENPPRSAAQQNAFLGKLEQIIAQRIAERPPGSYTTKLLGEGTRRIAQKVGEEGLELALAGVAQSDAEIIGEAADLLYHTLLLLKVKGLSLTQVVAELEARHAQRASIPHD